MRTTSKLHVDLPDACDRAVGVAAHLGLAHGGLRGFLVGRDPRASAADSHQGDALVIGPRPTMRPSWHRRRYAPPSPRSPAATRCSPSWSLASGRSGTGPATRPGRSARSSARSCSSSSPAMPRRPSTGGSRRPSEATLTPEALTATSDEVLRAAGLSANKLASLRDLSAKRAGRHRRPRAHVAAKRRGAGRAAHQRPRHRPLDGGDVPDVPAPPARRLAGRRPRRAPGLRRSPGASTRRRRRSSSIRWASGSARTGRSSPATAGRPCRCCGPGRPTRRCGDHLNGTVTGPGRRR